MWSKPFTRTCLFIMPFLQAPGWWWATCRHPLDSRYRWCKRRGEQQQSCSRRVRWCSISQVPGRKADSRNLALRPDTILFRINVLSYTKWVFKGVLFCKNVLSRTKCALCRKIGGCITWNHLAGEMDFHAGNKTHNRPQIATGYLISCLSNP